MLLFMVQSTFVLGVSLMQLTAYARTANICDGLLNQLQLCGWRFVALLLEH